MVSMPLTSDLIPANILRFRIRNLIIGKDGRWQFWLLSKKKPRFRIRIGFAPKTARRTKSLRSVSLWHLSS
jgi:hypothetical protein